ncbi:MAG: intradiol ring-cleavage dioxygenase, partial [Chitinophagaceae bacterium]
MPFKRVTFYPVIAILLFILNACGGNHQSTAQGAVAADPATVIGGPFENAGFIDIKKPAEINATDTSPGWKLNGEKLLIRGKVLRRDGKTAAPGVLVYYYQTDTDGRYLHHPAEPRSMPPNKAGQTHGYIRGWVLTDSAGSYSVFTVRPAPYPTHDEPAHIHVTIQEPGLGNPYYIDEFVFDDDPLLDGSARRKLQNRGGSGILRPHLENGLLVAEHNIILGLNVPGYPEAAKQVRIPGPQVGEDQPSFSPFHVYGPDKGSTACPVCKYGRYDGILYFVGNRPDWTEIKQWLRFLETQSESRGKHLKCYFIYGNSLDAVSAGRNRKLTSMGSELNLNHVALTVVPSFRDEGSDVHL